MTDSIIQGVTDFFMQCPLLKNGTFRVDAMGSEAIEYTIEPGIFTPIQGRYVDGSTERQYQFNFSSREYFSMDRVQNIQNSSFYEEFADWVEKQSRKENFPDMPEGCTPQYMTALSSGYKFDTTLRYARYQIQLQIIYIKEA